MVESGLFGIAIPVPRPTVGTNTEFSVERQLGGGDVRRVVKVQAPIARKLEVGYLLKILEDGFYAIDLVAQIHGWPCLVEWDPMSMFHDDVFTPYDIGGVVTPVKDFWDGNACFGLY